MASLADRIGSDICLEVARLAKLWLTGSYHVPRFSPRPDGGVTHARSVPSGTSSGDAPTGPGSPAGAVTRPEPLSMQ